MPTERYQAPYGAMDAADGAVKALTMVNLARWTKRWAIWLPIAFVISWLDPVMAPLKWWALGFAGASLAFILLVGFALRSKTRSARANIVDAEARVHAYEDEIELKAIGERDDRDG